MPLLFLAFVYDTVSSEYTSFSEEQKPLKISFITNVSKGHKLTGSSFMLKHKPDDRFQKGPFPPNCLRQDVRAGVPHTKPARTATSVPARLARLPDRLWVTFRLQHNLAWAQDEKAQQDRSTPGTETQWQFKGPVLVYRCVDERFLPDGLIRRTGVWI